jgi:hypothetical protein
LFDEFLSPKDNAFESEFPDILFVTAFRLMKDQAAKKSSQTKFLLTIQLPTFEV